MSRARKVYATLITAPCHAVTPRHAVQVEGVVRASSKRAAAAAFGMSLYEFNQYACEVTDAWTKWRNLTDLLDAAPDGTVFICPKDPRQLIDGTDAWIAL